MEIKVSNDVKNMSVDAIVISMFENEKTSQEIANTYAIERDNFEGKKGQTYLLQTYDKIPAKKILVLGCGKRADFCENTAREVVYKAVKKLQQMHVKTAAFDLDFGADYGKHCALGAVLADYAFDK